MEAKKLVENLVRSSTNNYQILRLPSLYGKEMKLNQIYRIATEREPKLTLSGESTFSLLEHEFALQKIRTVNGWGNNEFVFKKDSAKKK